MIEVIEDRLRKERGAVTSHGAVQVALTYPSPYRVGMSSLGFQVVYGILNGHPGASCERAFLPDDIEAWRRAGGPLLTYESLRPVGDFDVIAFSLSYELEIVGVMECLRLAGLPVLAAERSPGDPLVVVGGPLTFSNPVPVGPFADVVIMGEAEQAVVKLVEAVCANGGSRDAAFLRSLSDMPGFWVPSIHGEELPDVLAASPLNRPASSVILTPETELSNMHLVEAERGCHRACTFCVMRRSTNGGMRLYSPEAILETIPDAATKVGLVGAAVSDHPKLVEIVNAIVASGREVSLSSLRADRLTPELMEGLAKGGYKTVTVASDGASERLRIMMMKHIRAKHLRRAAELVRDHGMKRLKVYMMVGVPNETEEDMAELVEFSRELSEVCRVAMGIAPFVAKRNTPLDRQPFAGIKKVERQLKYLRREVGARVDLRSTSARWAWVEYCLAQGGFEMGRAAMAAWEGGGSFGAWKRAIKASGAEPRGGAAAPSIPKNRAERLAIKAVTDGVGVRRG